MNYFVETIIKIEDSRGFYHIEVSGTVALDGASARVLDDFGYGSTLDGCELPSRYVAIAEEKLIEVARDKHAAAVAMAMLETAVARLSPNHSLDLASFAYGFMIAAGCSDQDACYVSNRYEEKWR